MLYPLTMDELVIISSVARKRLEKAPKQVQVKFFTWVEMVNTKGLEATRLIKAFHDEPLKGQRQGQRSIRLNRQWRAIYRLAKNGSVQIQVLEVTPHDYRV